MTRLFAALILIFITVFSGPLPAQEARTAIHKTADQVQPLLPGMMAPAFTLQDVEANTVVFDPANT